jgi:hypothetical protein
VSEPHQTLPFVNSLRARDLTLRYFSSFYKCFRRIYKYGMRERGRPERQPRAFNERKGRSKKDCRKDQFDLSTSKTGGGSRQEGTLIWTLKNTAKRCLTFKLTGNVFHVFQILNFTLFGVLYCLVPLAPVTWHRRWPEDQY